MTDEPDAKRAQQRRVEQRAEELLPEEQEAGSADPEAQAAQILAESDARTDDRDARAGDEPDQAVEHRKSEDTVDPV